MADTDVIHQNRANLYGLDRNKVARDIRKKLTVSHILGSGEYNFDIEKSKDGVWKTSTGIDYRSPHPLKVPGNVVQIHGPSKGKGQLKKHFEFGSSRDQAEENAYHQSLTKEDYNPKGHVKPAVLQEDRTVNWPDMAPQYAVDRSIGKSEYDGAFLDKALPESGPDFPRINTCKTLLPQKETKVKFNRTVNVRLGSDEPDRHTETQRSFTAPAAPRGNLSLLEMLKGSAEVSENMLKMARNSNVFRRGDYNDAKQETGSTFTLDYGKRLATPNTVKVLPDEEEPTVSNAQDDIRDTDRPPMPQVIGQYLKDNLEGVYTEATRGKSDQTNAHFQFGSDDAGKRSVYEKDFGKDTRTKAKVSFCLPPEDSKVMAFDPALSSTGNTTTKSAHAANTFNMGIPANALQRERTKKNLAKRHGNNVILTYNKDKHAEDRQVSLCHESYVKPPSDFKALAPQKTPARRYNYIEADAALSYSTGKEKISEAQTQFRPLSMDAASSRDRQTAHSQINRAMKEWGRDTHFINGYVPMSFNTENRDLFRGKNKDVVEKPAAGKTERKTPFEFPHHDHSANTQDNQPEPNSVSQRKGIPQRAFPALATHKASLMTNDYPPLDTRKFTPAQHVMLKQDSKLGNKTIASSHLFHTDTAGGRNFTTTAMSSYIKPELMSIGTPRNMASVQ